VRNPLLTAARVVTSGRFVTRWTFVAIAVLSLTVVAPLPAGLSTAERLEISALTAIAFAAPWAIVALAERRISRASGRALLVGTTLVVTALARPVLQDAVSSALSLPIPGPEALAFRAGTNLAVWTIALLGTATLVDAARSTRETNALLREVLAQWRAADTRAHDYAARARRDLDDAARVLGAERPPTLDAVRALATDVRAQAHALTARAHESVDTAPETRTTPRPGRGGRMPSSRAPRSRTLRLPPVALTAAIYAVAVMPYALRSVPPAELVQGLLVCLGCGAAGDLLVRLPALRRRRAATARAYAAVTLLAGAILSTVAVAQGVPLSAAVVPALVYPALALALTAARGGRYALHRERRRLSAAVTDRARADDLETRRFRGALLAAAERLHRDVQGETVSFALTHPDAAPREIATFLASMRSVATDVRGALDAPVSETPVALHALVQTWGRAMPVRARVDDDVERVLRTDPALARNVVEVVAEGLLNAAKHARERRADVDVRVVATAAGPRLRVEVVSPGAPPPRAQLRAGSRVHALGARLVAAPETTALVAIFAVAPGSVVSTEHDPRRRREPA